VDGALAKILRVQPAPLRTQVEALEQALGFTAAPSGAPVGGAVALALADAIRRRRRVRFAYRSFSGEPSRRDVSPYGLVVHSGRWYLAAYDHGREDLRTFRVDRATGVAIAREAARPPDDGFDAVAHVSLSLARVPWTWEVEVLLTRLEEGRALPRTSRSSRRRTGGRCSGCGSTARLDGGRAAGLGCDFEIRAPSELGGSVRALADRLSACA
jgi:predicted DNA-binding transcriptional regulator YafY